MVSKHVNRRAPAGRRKRRIGRQLAYNPGLPPIAARQPMSAAHRPALHHAPLRVGGRVRAIACDGSPLRDLTTQLAFKVTGSPAVLSQAVRDPARG
ncbi:hypothetical protein CKCBHOJB_03055 [Thauera sp. GDN1]|nr:hypothetical protein CKCBHOJB_03055 [Thauera sp. GDN1]